MAEKDLSYDENHLKDLLDLEDGLTDWEMEFVDSLSTWDGPFTEKQRATMYKIYKARI